ncbi:MAG: hypothetical protein HONDAALG_04608 [Gammaproteobacteria bacterium]|nr:hypothetical protein [Gammaproteobacteria bacterium]
MNKQQNELNHEGGINYLEANSAEEIKGVIGATEQTDALSDLEPEGEVVGGALKGKPQHLVDSWTQHNETMAGDDEEAENESLDDLDVKNDEQVKGGRTDGAGQGGPIFNHNETTAEDDDAEVVTLDDLMLSDAQGNDVKAGSGCPGCGWGPPLANHNETTAEDDEAEPEAIADLPMENDEQVKAGGTAGGGAGKANLQDLHFTTRVAY